MTCARAARRELRPGEPPGQQAGRAARDRGQPRRDRRRAPARPGTAARDRRQGGGARPRADEISTIKFFVAGVLQRVLDRAIQVHGALGLTDDTPVAFWYRHERGARIYDGPDEVHKSAVARHVLAGPTAWTWRSDGGRARPRRPRRPAARRPRRRGDRRRRARRVPRRGPCPSVEGALDGRAVPARLLEPHLPGAVKGGRELVLRRPPPGASAKSAHDMGASIGSSPPSPPVYPKAPRPLALLRGRVRARRAVLPDGARPRRHPARRRAAGGRARGAGTMQRRSPSRSSTRWRELHALDHRRARPRRARARPEGYVERQVKGWTERYQAARTDDVPAMDAVAPWLAAHRPPASPTPALIHNDFKYDNVVLDPARSTASSPSSTGRWRRSATRCMDLGHDARVLGRPGRPARSGATRASWTLTARPGNLAPRGARRALRAGGGARPRRDVPLRLRVRPLQGRRDRAADLRALPAGPHPGPALRPLDAAVAACASAAARVAETGRIDGLGS